MTSSFLSFPPLFSPSSIILFRECRAAQLTRSALRFPQVRGREKSRDQSRRERERETKSRNGERKKRVKESWKKLRGPRRRWYKGKKGGGREWLMKRVEREWVRVNDDEAGVKGAGKDRMLCRHGRLASGLESWPSGYGGTLLRSLSLIHSPLHTIWGTHIDMLIIYFHTWKKIF